MNKAFPSLLQPVAVELDEVLNRLRDILSPLARFLVQEFLQQENDLLVPPGLVLLSASIYNNKKSAVLPALFTLLVNIGSHFHDITNLREGKEKQLLILTGDYICAHLFQLLCETKCFFLLEKFARLISVMNEGNTILETIKVSPQENAYSSIIEGIRRRYGVFFGECCSLGGLFGGGTEEEREELYRFGVEFGINYGAKRHKIKPFQPGNWPCYIKGTRLGIFADELLSSLTKCQ